MTPADLKTRREALGLSQWEAARSLGISSRAYQYLEAGRTSRGAELVEIPLLHELAWREVERRLGLC